MSSQGKWHGGKGSKPRAVDTSTYDNNFNSAFGKYKDLPELTVDEIIDIVKIVINRNMKSLSFVDQFIIMELRAKDPRKNWFVEKENKNTKFTVFKNGEVVATFELE